MKMMFAEIEGIQMRFALDGLTETERSLLKPITADTFRGAIQRFEHSLLRCTFFGNPGYDSLQEATAKLNNVGNVHIEGNDWNPFDQHYWIAFDFLRDNHSRVQVIIDPIFGYAGRKDQAAKLLHRDYAGYYYPQRRRIGTIHETHEITSIIRTVVPHVGEREGGVRIKTIGI